METEPVCDEGANVKGGMLESLSTEGEYPGPGFQLNVGILQKLSKDQHHAVVLLLQKLRSPIQQIATETRGAPVLEAFRKAFVAVTR